MPDWLAMLDTRSWPSTDCSWSGETGWFGPLPTQDWAMWPSPACSNIEDQAADAAGAHAAHSAAAHSAAAHAALLALSAAEQTSQHAAHRRAAAACAARPSIRR